MLATNAAKAAAEAMAATRAAAAPDAAPVDGPAAGPDWIARSRLLIDRHLDAMLHPEHPSPVMEAMRYSVLAPGKRIRPMLTLAVTEFLGGDRDCALHVGCAIEMIHCASLILDDLPCMDNDRERRNRLCTHVRFGESLTILAAVSLLTQSQCMIASHAVLDGELRLKLIDLLCDTVGPRGLSLGQHIDLSSKDSIPSPGAMTDMHHLKTGVLFMAAARAGCLVGRASAAQEEKLLRFTMNLGLAFQLADDIRDIDTDGVNMAARMGMGLARRKLRDYLDTADAAIAGEEKSAVLRHLMEAFFRKA